MRARPVVARTAAAPGRHRRGGVDHLMTSAHTLAPLIREGRDFRIARSQLQRFSGDRNRSRAAPRSTTFPAAACSARLHVGLNLQSWARHLRELASIPRRRCAQKPERSAEAAPPPRTGQNCTATSTRCKQRHSTSPDHLGLPSIPEPLKHHNEELKVGY